jgi:uncharacterized protein (DUF169 family)
MNDDTPRSMQDTLMNELRLMHYPISVKFLFDEAEMNELAAKVEHCLPVRPLTFCQAEVAVRMEGKTVLLKKDRLGCINAKYIFGWKGLDAEEIESHMKWVSSKEQAEAFILSKPRLPDDALAGVMLSPLAEATAAPDVVHFYCDNMQAYHLGVYWMSAMNIHPMPQSWMVSSAACGGNLVAHLNKSIAVFLACSGSYNAGKTERGEINVFIPGEQLPLVVRRLRERKNATGGASVNRPGNPFPGADICKNCSYIDFKKG